MATATQMDSLPASIEDRAIPDGWHRAMLDMSPQVYELLERLAQEAGTSKADVIHKALGLYTAALEARREGLVVGVASEDQPLDTEFVGC